MFCFFKSVSYPPRSFPPSHPPFSRHTYTRPEYYKSVGPDPLADYPAVNLPPALPGQAAALSLPSKQAPLSRPGRAHSLPGSLQRRPALPRPGRPPGRVAEGRGEARSGRGRYLPARPWCSSPWRRGAPALRGSGRPEQAAASLDSSGGKRKRRRRLKRPVARAIRSHGPLPSLPELAGRPWRRRGTRGPLRRCGFAFPPPPPRAWPLQIL